jgi:hypothetical protein
VERPVAHAVKSVLKNSGLLAELTGRSQAYHHAALKSIMAAPDDFHRRPGRNYRDATSSLSTAPKSRPSQPG